MSKRVEVKAAIPVNIPVAPSMGHITHVDAFKGQPDFGLNEVTRLVSGSNPWRNGSRAWPIFELVLRRNPVSTVGRLLELIWEHCRIPDEEAMTHLRWLYTWGGSYLEVGGRLYAPPPIVPVVRPRRKKKRALASAR